MKLRFASLSLSILATVCVYTAAAQFPTITPESAGFSSTRLDRIDGLIQEHIDSEKIAGVVGMILRDGKAVYLKSFGMMDREADQPMRKDAIFRIASMSKAVTSVAVMMLYEEGRFLLNDPLYKFIPSFKDAVVAVEPPKDSDSELPYATVPAKRPITIRHLLTHTAGLTYGDGLAEKDYRDAGLYGWYLADKDETIGVVIERLADLPLHAHPGDRWQYGYSTDVLGYLIEVVSGMPLDRFFEDRIFKPLGMEDTYFYLPRKKADRLAPVYGVNEEGKLELRESNETTDYLRGPRKCFSGGAGLLSTITDYGRFLQMLLNGGSLDGVRLLGPKTVELMRVNHVGDMYDWGDTGFGLGFWVIEHLGRYGEVGSEDSYGWGSAYYPIYWIDPEERLIGIIMTQLLPAGGLNLHNRFRSMVYHALVE